jgi:hypothetical protein
MSSQHLRKTVALVVAVLAIALQPAAAGASSARDVAVSPSISGSTLTVGFEAQPHARCSLRLDTGRNATRLPKGKADGSGRGSVSYSLPADTPSGRQPVAAACRRDGSELTGRAYVGVPRDLASQGRQAAVGTAVNVLIDVLLAGSLLFFVVLLVDMVVRAAHPRERLMRSLALVGGAIVALAADASGVSFSTYTIDTLTGARPGGEVFKAFAVVVPGGLSAFFAWYFVRVMGRSAEMGLRLMSFLGMLTVIAFAVIFAQATATEGVTLGAAAVPNASFVVGLIFGVVVFTPTSDGVPRRKLFGGLRDAVGRHRRGAGLAGGGRNLAPAPTTRNPFVED